MRPVGFDRAGFVAQIGWGAENAAHRIALPFRNPTVTADVAVTSTFVSGLFPTLADASKFFQAGTIGWSPTRNGLGLQRACRA